MARRTSEKRTFLESAAATGAEATIVANIERVPSQSSNVVARWPGLDAAAEPVVVTTPRSGWWHCASERGGGIAAWLEVARKVVEAAPLRPVWFLAFSGHELGHLGSDAFLQGRETMVKGASAWVHFGASVGGAVESAVRVGASDAEFLEMARLMLTDGGITGMVLAPAGLVPGLESQDVHARGGRVVALLGGNSHFHLLSDRWPHAVDPAAVAIQANAVANLVLELATTR